MDIKAYIVLMIQYPDTQLPETRYTDDLLQLPDTLYPDFGRPGLVKKTLARVTKQI